MKKTTIFFVLLAFLLPFAIVKGVNAKTMIPLTPPITSPCIPCPVGKICIDLCRPNPVLLGSTTPTFSR